MAPGVRSHRYRLERNFISAMQGILANLAETMVAQKIRRGRWPWHIGPTFEYVELPADGKKDHLRHLCDAAMTDFPNSAETTACAGSWKRCRTSEHRQERTT